MFDLTDWKHFWTSGDYVLHRKDSSPRGIRIIGVKGKGVLHIEDDDLHDALVMKMREEGVPIVTEPPKEAFAIRDSVLQMIDDGLPANEINDRLAKTVKDLDEQETGDSSS